MSDDPKVSFDLRDLIYRIDPAEEPLIVAAGRLRAKETLDELARENPEFAASRRRHEREMKTWRRERKKLSSEISQLQVPFWIVATLHDQGDPMKEMASVVLRVCGYLFDSDAPAELMRDLLRVAKRWLPE